MAGGAGAGGGLVILDRNPIARSMLRTLLAARAGEIIFADEPADAMRALDSASRLLVDAASLADSDVAILAALSNLEKSAREQSVALYVLWRNPDAQVTAAIATMRGVELIEKPIAGPALAARLFDGDGRTIPPLATRAA
jgi:response regulator RpfG family c-di-GMP phosphodiesterase